MGVPVFNGNEYEFNDRVLAHLETAIVRKLLRREAFPLSWGEPTKHATTLWIAPSAPLVFQYSEPGVQDLNPVWVGVLEWSSGRPHGMRVLSEEQAEAVAKARPPAALDGDYLL